jgi:hypothetical protein
LIFGGLTMTADKVTIHTAPRSSARARKSTTGRPVGAGNALDAAEATFRLLVTGPSPLALDGAAIGHGLPPRMVDLAELTDIVLAPAATDRLRDAVWAELVRRSREDGPSWVIGCVGVALPGLVNIAARATRTASPSVADDIVSELLTEFVAQLKRIDVTRPHIAERLLLWARKAAARARGRDERHLALATDALPALPASDGADPATVLHEAVRQGIITSQTAALIQATRLDGIPLAEYADARGEHPKKLYARRQRAEARLAEAISQGQLCANFDGVPQKPGL